MKLIFTLCLLLIVSFLTIFFVNLFNKNIKLKRNSEQNKVIVTNKTQEIPNLNSKNNVTYLEEINELSEVFYAIKPDFSKLDESKLITIISTGDVMMSRQVNVISEEKKDYLWMTANVKDLISSADITFINFENPIKKDCPLTTSGMIFCAKDKNILALKELGVDVAGLGNNHALDQGSLGLTESEEILNNAEIKTVGVKNPMYIEAKGKKISFLAYTELSCNEKYLGCIKNREKIKNDIIEARKNADLVIPMFHWGVEYTTQITTLQKEVAKLAIDNGADLVLGNHPHWIQPIEVYKGKLILYSHGNFIFDQMWSQKTREGLVSKFYFYDNKLIYIDLIPILIEDYGRPKVLENAEKLRQIEYIKSLSAGAIT